MLERPAPSISELGGAAIRPMTDDDYGLVRALWRSGDNSTITSSLAVDEPGFVAAARSERWSSPMILELGGEQVGAAVIGAADQQHRHGRLMIVAEEPGRLVAPIALYLRQVFWSHPLHRLYALLPPRPGLAGAYAELLRDCGFVPEGRLVGHLRVGSRLLDLDVFGLLRHEFDAWCRAHRPELAL